MATFKVEIPSHTKRKDGTYNIKIRITHNRRNKYIPTQYYATSTEVTKKMVLKNQILKDATDDLVRKYRNKCNKLGDKLDSMSVEQVADFIIRDENFDGKWTLNFIEYGRRVANDLRASGHPGNANTYDVAINSLESFVERDRLDISEVNTKFLQSYIEWLQNKPAPPKRVKGERAVSLYLSNIRALHNKAKMEYNDEDNSIIRIPLSPFAKIKVPTPPMSRKRALTIEQIQSIINLEYTSTTGVNIGTYGRFNFAKDMFILSFCLVGMNTADLYNCTSYANGRITYQRTKTKNRRLDKAEISIMVEPEIGVLLEKYRDTKEERVFDFYNHYINANNFNYAVNKGLKLIGDKLNIEDLEFYAARHSWATIALNDCKVDKYTVHTALNHVDERMKITDIYIKKDFTIIDDANRKVLDLFEF